MPRVNTSGISCVTSFASGALSTVRLYAASSWFPPAPCVPVSSVTKGWNAHAAAGSRVMQHSGMTDDFMDKQASRRSVFHLHPVQVFLGDGRHFAPCLPAVEFPAVRPHPRLEHVQIGLSFFLRGAEILIHVARL